MSHRTLLVLVVFLSIFTYDLARPTDIDFWWHLRTGQLIAETGAVPRVDSFSFTAAGRPWVAHEWLWELGVFHLYRLGGFRAAVLLSGLIVTLTSTATISTQAKASGLISTLQTSLTNVNSALAQLSAGAAKFSIQATFTQKLSDTLTAGIGNLVDANMAEESASLQSLQVKQQLGIQALSIANQAPQSVLSLFK